MKWQIVYTLEMLSHLSHSKASNRYRRELSTVHSLCLCVCAKCFRFLTIAWSHIPGPSLECGRGRGRGRLPEISISRKSALLSRHNSMGFICVCHFCCCCCSCCSTSPLVAVIFHFDFSLPLLPLSIFFFIVANPEASRAVAAGQLRPEGGSLCVCRQFGASNH